jgi:hypothetical protein
MTKSQWADLENLKSLKVLTFIFVLMLQVTQLELILLLMEDIVLLEEIKSTRENGLVTLLWLN